MHSLNKNMLFWFYTLLIVGSVLVIASFVDISEVVQNYSLEQRWDVVLDRINGSGSISNFTRLSAVLEKKNIPPLLTETKDRLFGSQKDLTELETAVDKLKSKSTIRRADFANVVGLAREALAQASKNELSFLKMIVVTVVGFGFFVIIFMVFIPQKLFLKRMDSISEELSDLRIEKVSRIEDKSFLELKKLVNAFNVLVDKFGVYKSILDVTERSKTIGDLTEEFYGNFKDIVRFNRVAFSTIDGKNVNAEVALSDSKEIYLKPPFVQNLNDSSLDEVLNSHKPRIIDDLEEYLANHPSSEATRLLVEEGMGSSLTFPIYVDGKGKGFLFLDSFEKKGFSEADIQKFETLQTFISLAYQKTTLTRDLIVGTVTSFTKLVEKKDNETGLHLVRMASYSRLISEELFKKGNFEELTPRYIQQIYFEAPLHDIGKVGIPDRILLKPGKLDRDEFEIMKTHSAMGAEILEEFDRMFEIHGKKFLEIGSKIARYHHEKWNGGGYPEGLRGDEIPLCARIVAVADVFDALTSKRPYKEAFDYDRSVGIITEGSGTHFDPEIVEAFMKAQPEVKKIYEEFGEV